MACLGRTAFTSRPRKVSWRWYEEGHDREPTDSGATASHDSYVSHHEAPQYFGYLANNPALRGNFRGLGDFFTDMATGARPPDGGVFYIRGGRANIFDQTPYVLGRQTQTGSSSAP